MTPPSPGAPSAPAGSSDRARDGAPAPHGDDAPDRPIAGHTYDGIKEYDNPMPGWWVKLFWVTIAFSAAYVLGIHVFGVVPTYGSDLAAETRALEAQRAAYAAANPAFSTDPEAIAAYAANADHAAAGAAAFVAMCAACHGDKGQGGIGPNLADAYWLHGASPHEVYETVTKGVLDKGMPAWEGSLSDEERGQIVAFIRSIQGTNPPGAKPPQGDEAEGQGRSPVTDSPPRP